MLAFFRAPGAVIRALPCQAECPIGHLVNFMSHRLARPEIMLLCCHSPC